MSQSKVTIVETISPTRYVLRCACCDRSGKMSRDHDGRGPYEVCTVCNGRGVVLVEISGSTPFVHCAVCKGSGEMSRDLDDTGPYVICTQCHGIGVQPITGQLKILR